jgi:hypothetical protein
MRRCRRVVYAVAALAALLDVVVAIVWRQWCRQHGYADQAAELELRTWP